MSTVLSTFHHGSLTLTLNRPDCLNAVSEEMYRELISELEKADAEQAVRAVILTGSGRAFCVGADLKAHGTGERSEEDRAEYVSLGQRVCEKLQMMSKPVIAAVHGYALGAGAEMAVSADFLIMGADAQMGFPEISIGTFVGGGVTHRLPRLVGLRKAIELLVLGKRFTGQQAVEWGLANAAVTNESVLAEAQGLAGDLIDKAPLSLARLKSSLRRSDPLETALDSEAENLLEIMKTEDWAEGVAAFAERRAPVFKGK